MILLVINFRYKGFDKVSDFVKALFFNLLIEKFYPKNG